MRTTPRSSPNLTIYLAEFHQDVSIRQISYRISSSSSKSQTDSPNFSKNNLQAYSEEELHQNITNFLISDTRSSRKQGKLITELKRIPIKELRNQTNKLLNYVSWPKYLEWLTIEKVDYLEKLFSELYIHICTSYSTTSDPEFVDLNIHKQVKKLIIKYIKKIVISECMFKWMVDEPYSYDCCSIAHHLFDLFSNENEPSFEDFSIDFLSDEFDYFIQNIMEMNDEDANLGKSAFVVFLIAKEIYNQTENNGYKDKLSSFFEDAYNEMKSDEEIAEHFEIQKDFSIEEFENLSKKVFHFIWNRVY